jgi:(p)ppGpp synthase/HD superfamily hydrolase
MYDLPRINTAPGSLERAIEIALMAQATDPARTAGVLHDVVEGGDGWTLDRLRAEGFSPEVVEAVNHLTKREAGQDDYPAFVQRAAANSIARQVKLADLADNCDLTRIAHPSEQDIVRIEKYRQAIAAISVLNDV